MLFFSCGKHTVGLSHFLYCPVCDPEKNDFGYLSPWKRKDDMRDDARQSTNEQSDQADRKSYCVGDAMDQKRGIDPWLRADAAEMSLRVVERKLEQQKQHLLDVYEAVGVNWGDDPFPKISQMVHWECQEERIQRLEEHSRAIYRALGLEPSPDVDPFPTIAALRLAGRRYALAIERGEVKEVDGRLTYFEPGRSETLLSGEHA